MKKDHNCKLTNAIKDILLLTLIYSFHADPSGTFMSYHAKAIGSGSEGAQNELEKEYHKVDRNIRREIKTCES